MTARAGRMVGVIDRPVDSYIRGLHFIGEGPDGTTPPMADLLNPETIALFLRLTHEKFFARLGKHFGDTIIGWSTCCFKGVYAFLYNDLMNSLVTFAG